jgi:hypothetical protein
MKCSTSLSCLVQPPYLSPAIVIRDRRKVDTGLLVQYQVNLKLPRGSSKHLIGVSRHRSIQTDNQAMSSTILLITSPRATLSWASAISSSGSRPATVWGSQKACQKIFYFPDFTGNLSESVRAVVDR